MVTNHHPLPQALLSNPPSKVQTPCLLHWGSDTEATPPSLGHRGHTFTDIKGILATLPTLGSKGTEAIPHLIGLISTKCVNMEWGNQKKIERKCTG